MKFIKQFSVIMTVSFLAQLLEILLPLPVTASIYGLVLMLVALVTKLIPLEKVEGAADFLVEILPVLFVPSTVSLIASVDALRDMLLPLVVISLVTTVLIMAVTGRTAQGIIQWEERQGRAGMEEMAEEGKNGQKGETGQYGADQ